MTGAGTENVRDTATEYLTLPELLKPAERLGRAEVRDYGLRVSARTRPQTSVFGQDAHPDLWHEAAVLMESLGQPRHDRRDKRLAWYATWVFLHLNGEPLDSVFDVDEVERFGLAVSQGHLDVPGIAGQLPLSTARV